MMYLCEYCWPSEEKQVEPALWNKGNDCCGNLRITPQLTE